MTAGIAVILLNGCAGSTTDPRQGGLFSYDPAAYEQRLAEREHHLSSIESDTAAQKRKSIRLIILGLLVFAGILSYVKVTNNTVSDYIGTPENPGIQTLPHYK